MLNKREHLSDLLGTTKNFAQITKLLKALTCHDAKFAWTSGHHTAFNTIKSALLEAPILHYPDFKMLHSVHRCLR